MLKRKGPLKRVRVVLLDDNEGVRNFLADILQDRGYEVYSYSDPGICPLQVEKDANAQKEKRALILLFLMSICRE